jgi:SAM-dependent methyltransferase
MPFHRHPLAFPLGLEGLALLRSFAGDISHPGFAEQRVTQIRRLLTQEPDAQPGPVGAVGTVAGYAVWAQTYDTEDNPLIKVEEPAVREILARLPVGRALDVACGTGRHTAWLAQHGHAVTGMDSSPAMLAKARERAPGVDFVRADLAQIPVPAATFDLVVCTLALTHHGDLPGALAEFTRVARPGGHVVLSDIHVLSLYLGGVPSVITAEGVAALPAHRYWASDYLAAILGAGLEVVSCREPRWFPAEPGTAGERDYPDAAAAAYWDTPALIVWQLRKPA